MSAELDRAGASTDPTPARAREWLFRETNVHPTITDRQYRRFLRYPVNRALTGPLADAATWARQWFGANAGPWLCGLAVEARTVSDGVEIAGELFGTAALAAQMAGLNGGVIVAASAGAESDDESARRWEAGEPDSYFFLESYAAAAAEALVVAAQRQIASRFSDRALLDRSGPGYRGWAVDEMPRLLALLRCGSALPAPGVPCHRQGEHVE